MTISLRPESPADEAFLRHLIVESVAEELGASVWPEPMRSHLLGIQYTGRRHSRRVDFPEAASYVILVNGADAGWLVLSTMPREVHIVDLMVLPELRGKGIGTAVIGEILSTAAGARKPVRLRVSVMNQASIRLYERLGFRKIDQDQVQLLMEAQGDRSAGG